MRLQLVGIVGGLIIACASSAVAQDTPEKVDYPKWDAATTLGFVVRAQREFGDDSGIYGNESSLIWNADIGRFLTTHIKADATVMTTNSRDHAFDPISGQSTGYVLRSVHPTAVSTGVTYQFFENAFMHPYVTGGIRLNVLREVRETHTYGLGVPTQVQISGKSTSVQVRPFGAFGVKSYFNARIFMKSELMVASDVHGISLGTARIGIGFDF